MVVILTLLGAVAVATSRRTERLAAWSSESGGTPMTWLLVAALFGVLGAAVTYVCWVVHAAAGCPACQRRALLQPMWKRVRALCGPSLWTKVLRAVDRAFVNERTGTVT